MRIVHLTPGTGNFHCGSCLRDNSLVRGLRQRGHDALMVPLYLPLVVDEPSASVGTPIFLSGLSVYLGNKFAVPGWLDRALSSPSLLRLAARLVSLTSPRQLGESALAMLQPDAAHGELERLIHWLRLQPAPDVICLSNSLLTGLAARLKQEFRVPIICSLQGEDSFLDGLPEPYRQQSWELLAQRCVGIDHFIAVSRYFAEVMIQRLNLPAERVSVVHPGIAVEEFVEPARKRSAAVSQTSRSGTGTRQEAGIIGLAAAGRGRHSRAPEFSDSLSSVNASQPVVGYLARMHPSKGLDTLVEAFLQLKTPGVRLRIAGAMTGKDKPFVTALRRRLGDRAEFFPNLDHAVKADFLRSLRVFSVPATYGEAFGMYVLEAQAAGVPVVQPRHGAFSEVLAATGGGILCEPKQPAALAAALDELLGNPARARQLGALGRQAVQEKFSSAAMTANIEAILQKVAHAR
jgi:glycosyltransferase involved in cell wall biosynthesis